MEFIGQVVSWSYPAIQLTLVIYCVTSIRRPGGGLLALAFGLPLVPSLLRLAVLDFGLVVFQADRDRYILVLDILGQLSFVANLLFVPLFIMGISGLMAFQLATPVGHVIATPGEKRSARAQPLGNVGLYLTLLYGGLAFAAMALAFAETETREVTVGLLVGTGLILVITAEVYFVVLLYRVWRFAISRSRDHALVPSIQTPGQAIGFLFIPLFGLYWVFRAFGQLARNLNAVAAATGSQETMPRHLGTVLATLALISIIPLIGLLAGMVGAFLISPLFIHQAITICGALDVSRGVADPVTMETTRASS